MARIEKLKSERTTHVYHCGLPLEEASQLWLVLHGYAQSPEEIIPIVEKIDGPHAFIIPEAFCKFYRKGFSGDVVSSWMTAKHRLDEIEDQREYMNQVYGRYFLDFKGIKSCLGFSQGVATANRWIESHANILFDHYILYAGWPPEDIDYVNRDWQEMDLHYALGNKDYFLPAKRVKALLDLPFFKELSPQLEKFNGGHQLDAEVLQKIIDRF